MGPQGCCLDVIALAVDANGLPIAAGAIGVIQYHTPSYGYVNPTNMISPGGTIIRFLLPGKYSLKLTVNYSNSGGKVPTIQLKLDSNSTVKFFDFTQVINNAFPNMSVAFYNGDILIPNTGGPHTALIQVMNNNDSEPMQINPGNSVTIAIHRFDSS
jgi:hypothetical protein